MNHLFGKSGLVALREFAAPGTLLGLDYDGTLTPICTHPDDAHLPYEVGNRLQRLARQRPTLILTGRASADVRARLGGIEGVEVIGNHGAETSVLIPPHYLQRRVAAWREALEARLAPLEGVSIEDKAYSLSVHYRASPDWDAALTAIREATMDLTGARTTGGKAVINVVLAEAPDKGTALLLACRRAACRRAIYVGDDDTDEDVFALNRPDEILTVHVGRGEITQAEYYLSDPDEVAQMLGLLSDLSRRR